MLVDEATYLHGKRVTNGTALDSAAFSWIGLFEPSFTEFNNYQGLYQLNSLAVEDALVDKQRPKIDIYKEHILVVLKTISYDIATKHIIVGDLSLFIEPSLILTVRHGEALPLTSIRADLESRTEKLVDGPTAVLHEIIDRLVDQYLEVASKLSEDVEQIEDDVFDDEKPAQASRMYFVKRELIDFRRAAQPLLEPLSRLATGSIPFIDAEYGHRFSDVRDHLLKVIDEIDAMSQLMDAALHANVALIQVNQNEDMRKISAWIGIAAVPTMIAGIYGMNFDYMPETGTKYGYFVVMGFLGLISFVLFRLFRKYKWL